uniref:Uncharacterized protein n=1 Tax=Panagrolaimus superbus TaxID=310955 RepID=A0A914Y1G3_9BILA
MRRQMPIVQKEFTVKERAKLPYPINAIEEAFKMNPECFKNTSLLNSNSGMEDDETQKTTHASDKRAKKESGAGKKKKAKKHHSKIESFKF